MAVYARGAGSDNCAHYRRQNNVYLLFVKLYEVCRTSGSGAEMDRLDASPKSEDVHSACVIGSYFAVSGLRLCTLVGTSSSSNSYLLDTGVHCGKPTPSSIVLYCIYSDVRPWCGELNSIAICNNRKVIV